MSNEWFYLALISPALWSIVILIDDNLISKVYKNPFIGTVIAGFAGFVPILSIFFVPITVPSFIIVFVGILTGFISVCMYWFYFTSLTIESPSVVSSLWNLGPAIVPFLSYLLLSETLTFNQYIGFSIILFASLAISAINIKKFNISKAFYLMLFASVLFAISSIMQKYIYNHADFWSGFVFVSLGMVLAGLFFSTCFKQGRHVVKDFGTKYKKYIWIVLISEFINIVAVLVSNLAVSKGPVSLVRVIEGIQPIYLLVFAILFYPIFPKFLREATYGGKTKKLFYMAIMIVGLYLINK